MPNLVPAAAEGMPNLNRRKALALVTAGFVLPAAATAAAAPLIVAPESEIMALFAEWLPLYERGYVEAADPLETDDEIEVRIERNNELMRDLEDRMAALPARDAREFAAKVIALTTFGEYNLDERAEALFADARVVLS